MLFHEVMRRERKARGLTQDELASLLGVPRTAIVQYEKNIRWPILPVAIQMAKILGFDLVQCECQPTDKQKKRWAEQERKREEALQYLIARGAKIKARIKLLGGK